jgi:hypothetical protein
MGVKHGVFPLRRGIEVLENRVLRRIVGPQGCKVTRLEKIAQ